MVDQEYAKRGEIIRGGSWSNFKRQREGKEKVDDEVLNDYGQMTTMEFRGEKEKIYDLEDIPYEYVDGKKRQRVN